MKKFSVLGVIALGLMLMTTFVSAEGLDSIKTGAQSFYNKLFEPLGKFLLGSADTGDIFFAKLLIFIILITLVNYAVSQIPALSSKAWIISAAVAILSVRFITPEWVATVVLPYTALGIALTSFLPFILYFFFVEKSLVEHTTMRKVAWIFAAVVFFGLFLYRNTGNQNVSDVAVPSGPGQFNATYIYLITAGLSLIMLFADRTIQRAFMRAKYGATDDIRKTNLGFDLHVAHDKLMTDYFSLQTPTPSDLIGVNSKIKVLNARAKAVSLPPFELLPT